MLTNWKRVMRPGYFGRKRDQIIAGYNKKYGEGNWSIRWCVEFKPEGYNFLTACIGLYEYSYLMWFCKHPEEVDFVCSFGECIDNAMTNIESGTDYTKQEAFSTHIQDIAIRNVLKALDRKFEGPKDKILVIRSADSSGYKYGPGNIPFYKSSLIEQPEVKPSWAQSGSVEAFWQSNKFLCVKER